MVRSLIDPQLLEDKNTLEIFKAQVNSVSIKTLRLEHDRLVPVYQNAILQVVSQSAS